MGNCFQAEEVGAPKGTEVRARERVEERVWARKVGG